MKGDSTVNAALDSQLERESQWTRKSSTIVQCDRILQSCVSNDEIFIPNESNTFNINYSRQIEIPRAKEAIKKSVTEDILELWNNKVNNLTMQGEFTKLLIEEQNAVTWQSVIRRVPRSVMSFAIRSATNSLPSPDNLRRWGKRRLSLCPLCSNIGTLEHIINFCKVALEQKRYNYRHDSVLQHITKEILKTKPDQLEVCCDIPGFDINGSTIPQDIIVASGTGSRPDLVLVNRQTKLITLMELTCCLEQNVEKAQIRKTNTYTYLKNDLEDKGFTVDLVPFEIGSRGHVSKTNIHNLINVFVKNNIKTNVLRMNKTLGKITLLCTFAIFHAYQQPTWLSPPLLEA